MLLAFSTTAQVSYLRFILCCFNMRRRKKDLHVSFHSDDFSVIFFSTVRYFQLHTVQSPILQLGLYNWTIFSGWSPVWMSESSSKRKDVFRLPFIGLWFYIAFSSRTSCICKTHLIILCIFNAVQLSIGQHTFLGLFYMCITYTQIKL